MNGTDSTKETDGELPGGWLGAIALVVFILLVGMAVVIDAGIVAVRKLKRFFGKH